ncbi:hypothetical protein LYNGBM3L_22960 [Moorena producens 3L]|uniref:Uncharacterized protein n=1 Tax=Moorena producens 3L TaxID=489825 RepID=F4XMW3_9CYAN|nr:hypothetical protein LYNGBM3L_22960 [Moorena producens 3L]
MGYREGKVWLEIRRSGIDMRVGNTPWLITSEKSDWPMATLSERLGLKSNIAVAS